MPPWLVVTPEGAVLIDSGATLQGVMADPRRRPARHPQARALVINTGGQDHRWLGNGYSQPGQK